MMEPNHLRFYDVTTHELLGNEDTHVDGTLTGVSCPGTWTFMPHRPVTKFMGMRTVPSAVSLESTSLIWLFASVISIEIWAR